MTPHQRNAHAFRLAALAATCHAGWLATRHDWTGAGFLVWGAFTLLFLGARCHTAHHAIRARHERARRAAHADPQALGVPVPCCSFWKHSGREVHAPDCTRPAAARRDDYRLDSASAAAFEEITAHYDDRSPA